MATDSSGNDNKPTLSQSKQSPPSSPSSSSSPLAPFLKSFGGDDCDRPACDDTKSALTAALERVGHSAGLGSRSANRSLETKPPPSFRNKENSPASYRACPPAKDAIGNSTWNLLHSMAAWYPDKPSRNDRQLMSNFITALAKFYPCTWCASDFQKSIEKSPPKTQSREELCIWLCEQHNVVNNKLGKPTFQCTMDNLDERWRKSSDPKC